MKPFCFVCQSKNLLKLYPIEKYRILKCQSCSFQQLDPLPTLKEIESFYKENYFAKDDGARGYPDYKLMRPFLITEAKKRIELIKKFSEGENLLDLGAGTGVFLEVASKSGFKISGNDISDFAVKELKGKGVKFYSGQISNAKFPRNTFDVITAWDVLEHIPNLNQTIANIVKALKKNGVFVITTPGTDCLDAKLLNKNWYSYKKIPEHVGFFDRQSITTLLEKHGLKVELIKQWGFVRDLDFVLERMTVYSSVFILIRKLTRFIGLSKLTLFFPLTDFILVARKR